jgi:hypothetical protein
LRTLWLRLLQHLLRLPGRALRLRVWLRRPQRLLRRLRLLALPLRRLRHCAVGGDAVLQGLEQRRPDLAPDKVSGPAWPPGV